MGKKEYMGRKERVILIKGDATKWYEQAIFIVNKDIPPENIPVDFVAEAEKIINNYIIKKRQKAYTALAPTKNSNVAIATAPVSIPATAPVQKKAKKRGWFDFMLNAFMVLGCLAIVIILAIGFLA